LTDLLLQVVAGNPVSPIVKSLTLDLERCGFIVYSIVTSSAEETAVHGASRPDIKPFSLDVNDVSKLASFDFYHV
jgi:hypothetical protein